MSSRATSWAYQNACSRSGSLTPNGSSTGASPSLKSNVYVGIFVVPWRLGLSGLPQQIRDSGDDRFRPGRLRQNRTACPFFQIRVVFRLSSVEHERGAATDQLVDKRVNCFTSDPDVKNSRRNRPVRSCSKPFIDGSTASSDFRARFPQDEF